MPCTLAGPYRVHAHTAPAQAVGTVGFEEGHPDGDLGGTPLPKRETTRDFDGERKKARAEREQLVAQSEQLERAVIRSKLQLHERDQSVTAAAAAADAHREQAEAEFANSMLGRQAKAEGRAGAGGALPPSNRLALSGSLNLSSVDVEAERVKELDAVLPHMQMRRKLHAVSAALDTVLRQRAKKAHAREEAGGADGHHHAPSAQGEPAKTLAALLKGLASAHHDRGEELGGVAGHRMVERAGECHQLANALEERLWHACMSDDTHLSVSKGDELMDLSVNRETTFQQAKQQACRYWELKPDHWCVADEQGVQWMPEMFVIEGLHRSPPGCRLHLLQRQRHGVPDPIQPRPSTALAALKAGDKVQGGVHAKTAEGKGSKGEEGFFLQRKGIGMGMASAEGVTSGTRLRNPFGGLPEFKREVVPRSRTAMCGGFLQALVLLSILSLSLDSTLFGIEVFDDFNREVWAANDVCTELRASITRTPFTSYGQRDFYKMRSPDDLYAWMYGPLATRLFDADGANSSRSALFGGMRVRQLRVKPRDSRECGSSWLDSHGHVPRYLFTTLAQAPTPPAPPPPLPPLNPNEQLQGVLTLKSTVAGDLSAFDEDGFQTNLAAALGVDSSDVAVSAVAGSVVVTAVVAYDDYYAAERGADTWEQLDIADATGLAIESKETATLEQVVIGPPTLPPSPASPPDEPGSGSGSEGVVESGRGLSEEGGGGGGGGDSDDSGDGDGGGGGGRAAAEALATGAERGDLSLCYPDWSLDENYLDTADFGLANQTDAAASLSDNLQALRAPPCIPDCVTMDESSVVTAFRYLSSDELGYALDMGGPPDSGYALTFAANTSLADVTDAIEAIKTNGWIDRQTRLIFVEYSVYNSVYGTAASMQLQLEQTGAGQIEVNSAFCNSIPIEALIDDVPADYIFPFMLLLWLLTYTVLHVRSCYVLSCNRALQMDQLVHWLVILSGYAALAMRGLSLYCLVHMKLTGSFDEGAPWPPPYLPILTLAVTVYSVSNILIALTMLLVQLRLTQYMSLFSTRLFVMRRTASNSLNVLKYVFIVLGLFAVAMAIFGHLVLGPTIAEWRSFDVSMRNLIPMLRRADAFDLQKAKSIDDTFLSVFGIYPVSSFFFVCAIFANSFILLNLTRAVVMHTYIKTDAHFWRKRPDDVTNEPIPNPLDYPKSVYHGMQQHFLKTNLKTVRKREYNEQLKERRRRAKEQGQEAAELHRENVEMAKKQAKEAARKAEEDEENGDASELEKGGARGANGKANGKSGQNGKKT